MNNKSNNPALQEFLQLIETHPEIRYLDVMVPDACGQIRGKRIPMREGRKVYETGVQIPESTHLLNVIGNSSDPCGRGFEDGDPDGTLFPIQGTTHSVPWSVKPTAQVLTRLFHDNGQPCWIDPRNQAERVVKIFNSLGYSLKIAFELEFYLISPKLSPANRPQVLQAVESGASDDDIEVYSFADLDKRMEFLDEVYRACELQKIPVSVMTSEYAPSQYEINLRHIDDPLVAADYCILLRRVVEELAKKHDMRATFMSKPFNQHAGSGMHVHLSLFDHTGANVFNGESELSSPLLRHATGGLLETTPDMFSIYVANHNAYRRFVPDNFVPVNPTWGLNNRSVAIRVPAGDAKSRRLEHRVSGADANPYLVLAAILAGVHYGIEQQVDPGEPSNLTNASATVDPDWPIRWDRALERFKDSEFAKKYLTPEYVELFYELKKGEMEEFYEKITDREYDWYL